MEQFQFSQRDGGIHIEGFPDAVKVIALNDKKAERLAHMALHKSDLDFARASLEAINKTDNTVLREAAWRMAVVTLNKCFDGSARRSRLDAKAVYGGDALGLTIFRYFEALRNKHIVHDENGYAQAHPGAIINNLGVSPKVPKAFTLVMWGVTLNEGDYSNLHLLISKAITYVTAQYDEIANAITAALEQLPHEELIAQPSVSYTVPPADAVTQRRETP